MSDSYTYPSTFPLLWSLAFHTLFSPSFYEFQILSLSIFLEFHLILSLYISKRLPFLTLSSDWSIWCWILLCFSCCWEGMAWISQADFLVDFNDFNCFEFVINWLFLHGMAIRLSCLQRAQDQISSICGKQKLTVALM